MIISQLLGGLGNQMFQYAAGRRLAFDRRDSLLLDSHLLDDRSPGKHSVFRQFALDVFEGPFTRAPLSRTIPFSAWGLPRFARGVLKLTGITNERRQTKERDVELGNGVFPDRESLYLAGLWQSVNYFKPIEGLLRKEFTIRVPMNEAATPILDRIRSTVSVCVHVRRTDYVTHMNSHSALGFVGIDYYKRGIAHIQDTYNDARFFIFSDDLQWSRENLGFIPDPTFVDASLAGYKDSGHLQLMSQCQVFLIPNSTFSWWAAWLGQRSEKQVYLPTKWFRDGTHDASGLYLPEWKQI